MSIYMLNKIRTEPEIFASNVDHVAAKSDKDFIQSFDFESRYRRQVSCCGFFLIGVLTIE
jgi:hypothetical protein